MSDTRYEDLRLLVEQDEGAGIYPMGHLSTEERAAFGQAPSDAYKCGWNDAVIDGHTTAKKLMAAVENSFLDDDIRLLLAAGSFRDASGTVSLNMNDTWAWAASWCPEVPANQLSEVARLFRTYGNAGLMYWHSCQEKDMRSEFADNNRALDFVRREEALRKEVPDNNKRAYTKISYVLGADK